MNYTRDLTNGTYWVIGRLATDINLSGSLTMSVVNPDTTLTKLGAFTNTNGLGWTTFENLFAGYQRQQSKRETEWQNHFAGGELGQLIAELLRAGRRRSGFADIERDVPHGLHPLEYASNLTFTVASTGATFPANSIKVNLDGFDVSSALVISGPATNETVVYSDLLPNAIHTAIITATNSLGHGIAVTNQFDTFDPNNVMVEASDFDYSGGQYISSGDWYPNSYSTFPPRQTSIFNTPSLAASRACTIRLLIVPMAFLNNRGMTISRLSSSVMGGWR